METIAYIPIAGLGVGIVSLVAGFILQKQCLLLGGFVLSATFMTSPFVQTAAVDSLGHGIVVPLAGFIAIMLGLEVVRRRLVVPEDLAGMPGALLLCGLMTCLLSGLNTEQPLAVLKAALLLFLSIVASWCFIGTLAAGARSPREVTQSLVDGIGTVSIGTTALVLVVLGPACTVSGDGGLNNQVAIFGLPLARLGVQGFNATGVTAVSAVGLLYLFASIDRWRGLWVIAAAAVSAALCSVALLWSGSRGGLAALISALAAIRALQWMFRAGRRSLMLVDGVVALCVTVLCLHLTENFWRDPASDPATTSALAVFLESRVPDEIRGKLDRPGLFGWGYSAAGATGDSDDPNIESYWLKGIVELGAVGVVVYTLMFIILTSYVVKADVESARRGEAAAFAPSAIVFFVWANSVSSWGFINPFGDTTICLAMMSSACIALHSRRWRAAQCSGRQLCEARP